MELQYAQPPSHEDILRVIRRNLNTEPSCEKVSCIEMSFLLQMVDLERRNMVFFQSHQKHRRHGGQICPSDGAP